MGPAEGRSRTYFAQKLPSADKPYAVQTINLTGQAYDGELVRQINFHLPQGAIYNLIGRNNAGKTTLLHLLLGIRQPDSGEILFFGQSDESALTDVRRSTGFFLGGSFYPYLSALKNLSYLARLKGLSRPSFEAERVLHLCEFRQINERCGSMSAGRLKHLGVAAALLGHPEILILDDPLTGLDLQTEEAVMRALRTVNQTENLTVLLTSNLSSNISPEASHVGLMDKGLLVHETTMAKLQEACRSEIILKVDQPAKACWLLEQAFGIFNYSIDGEQRIHIRAFPPAPESLSAALAEAGIRIDLYYPSDLSIGDYCRKVLGE